jgi:hypothetical protein
VKYRKIGTEAATEENYIIELAHCENCNYIGNNGLWRGIKRVDGKVVENDRWKAGNIPALYESTKGEWETISVVCPMCGKYSLRED